MYNLPSNIYLVSIIVFFQGFLVLVVIYLFIDKFFSLRKQRIATELARQQAYKDALKLLDEARTRSQSIITDATSKAAQIISNADYVSNSAKDSISQALRDVVSRQEKSMVDTTASFVSVLKSDFDKERLITLAGLDSLLGDMKNETSTQLSQYGELLTKHLLDTQDALKTRLEQEYSEAKAKISAYTAKETEKIKEISYNVVTQIAAEYIGHSMSINDHESFIINLLDKYSISERFKK